MIVAGARAGVYDLKTMAFESMDCLLRAGAYSTVVLHACGHRLILLCLFGESGRLHAGFDVLYARLPRLAVIASLCAEVERCPCE